MESNNIKSFVAGSGSGWVGLILSGASEDAERPRFARVFTSMRERGTAGERNFATVGQNERPREKQAKPPTARSNADPLEP